MTWRSRVEFFEQVKKKKYKKTHNGAQLIHLYKFNLNMTIILNTYASYSAMHLKTCLNLLSTNYMKMNLTVSLVIESH